MNGYSEKQEQTKDTFSFKWGMTETYSSAHILRDTGDWLMQKYFDGDAAKRDEIFADGKTVLDAGCGAGMSAIALLGERLKKLKYIGVDISDAVSEARENLKKTGGEYEVIQCDLNNIDLKEKVDVIFSEGVLHHTDSTREAIINLGRHLAKGGYFLFYVYAKKAPIREYTDDYIREYFRDKSNEETWNGLESLTKFGKMLGDLNVTLHIDEDIPCIGVKKGDIDLQRFFYWNIFKCFYKPEYSIDEMNHINFDWYRPLNCHRQTPDEVRMWCAQAGLVIERMHVEEAGITVVARKGDEL